jgi:TonB family protein
VTIRWRPSWPMRRRRSAGGHLSRTAVLVVALALGATGGVRAQARAAGLVTAARAQLRAGNADSGLALLRLALDSGTVATGVDRTNAFVWQGVLLFYKGRDGLARESFREALTIDPRLEVAGLAQIDSLLAVEFESVRRTVQLPLTAARPSAALARLAGGPSVDTLYSCVPECRGLDQPPRALSPESQTVTVPGAGSVMGGVAVVRFVIDTTGAVEPASVVVVSSPRPGLSELLIDHVRRVRFAPGRVRGRSARVVLQWRLSVRSG